jgi:hypothetical protein
MPSGESVVVVKLWKFWFNNGKGWRTKKMLARPKERVLV